MATKMRNLLGMRSLFLLKNVKLQNNVQKFRHASSSNGPSVFKSTAIVVGTLGIGGGLYGYLAAPDRKSRTGNALTEKLDYTINHEIPDIKPSREVLGPAVDLGLDLTLYQYQSCPFCCKVRAFLDFYGIPYKVIEVNPVMRQQLKFSKYKKVPILIVQEKGSSVKHQLNDSSVIISILGTLLLDVNSGLEQVLKYYVPYSYKDDNGKDIEEVMNKYFLMYGDKGPREKRDEFVKKERQWRMWADKEFVHLLSPNIYSTFEESVQSFNYFSEVGEWEKNFSTLERLLVIYVGATAMYFVGKRLKKKYALKDDVRQSLYDGCKRWMKEIGPKNKFMGGSVPNLADLAVYGLLNSIEGCLAFKDLLANTNIGSWYYNVQEVVANHHGYKWIS